MAHRSNGLLALLLALLLGLCLAAPGAAQQQDIESYRMARSLALRGQADPALELFAAELERGFDPAQALADPAWNSIRRDPRFKTLVRDATSAAESWIAPYDEPGEQLLLSFRIATDEGVPVAHALVYAFQTDTEGRYSPDSDASQNPRLYGFARTDEHGTVAFHTIRPGSYPGEGVPRHVHFTVSAPGFEQLEAEVLFDDDPLLDEATRERARQRGWPIVQVGGAPGARRAEAALTLRRSN